MSGVKKHLFKFHHQNKLATDFQNFENNGTSYKMEYTIDDISIQLSENKDIPFLSGNYNDTNLPGFTFTIGNSSKKIVMSIGEVNFPPPRINTRQGMRVQAGIKSVGKRNFIPSWIPSNLPDRGTYFIEKAEMSMDFDESTNKASGMNIKLIFNTGDGLSTKHGIQTDTLDGTILEFLSIEYDKSSSTSQKEHKFNITDIEFLEKEKMFFVLITEPNTSPSDSISPHYSYIFFNIE